MNFYSRLQQQLNKPPSILEQEQFKKAMLDCIEPGIGYSFFSLVGCVALYSHVPTAYLVFGGSLIFLEAVVKISLVKKFEKQSTAERANPQWRRIIWLGGLYSGVAYGLFSLVLFLPLPQENLMLLAFCYLGIFVTSCWLGSSYWPLLASKLIPLSLPLIVAFVLVATPMSVLASLALLFISAMSLYYVRSIVRQHAELVYARQRIEEISENLNIEKLAAEQLVVDKNRFIASASHDLRQPLHALGLFHSAIRFRSKDEKIHELLDSIDSSTAALNNLFEGLLDVSRFDSGAVNPIYEHFEIDRFANAMHDEFSEVANTKNLQLETNCDPGVVVSDRLLVEQVIRNLLGNALKFTTSGRVELSARCSKTSVLVSVSDTGPGISEEEIENIFDEFHQLERSQHHEGRGFGLGLAIVGRITDLLDIPLNITSTRTDGTCITLELPAGNRELIECISAPKAATSNLLNTNILVIDDNVNILDGMQSLLSDWGITCLTAPSHEDAIQSLRETGFVPDLLICDYHLSVEAKGPGIAHAICEFLGQNMPVVIITGDTSIDNDSSNELEGLDILYKPVHPDELRKSIVLHAGKRSLSNEQSLRTEPALCC